jgi:hypothetical protein
LKPAATTKLKEPAATKKLKTAATAARLESAKIKHSQSASDGAVPEELKPHLKNLCTFLCNVCHDSPISAYCAETNLFFCNYCKVLENKKQARLARPESIKGWSEEEDAEETLVVSRVTAPTTALWMKSVKDWDTFYPTAYAPVKSPSESTMGRMLTRDQVKLSHAHETSSINRPLMVQSQKRRDAGQGGGKILPFLLKPLLSNSYMLRRRILVA